MRAQAILLLISAAALTACQDYLFEYRMGTRVRAKKINEVVATVVPVDILFVVDNSGSMTGEIEELRDNVGVFIDAMSASDNEFQVGLITTDVECNIPTKDCSVSGTTSYSCCNLNPSPCEDTKEADVVVASTCDGGRLRASNSGQRVFARPGSEQRAQWVADFTEILDNILDEVGSGKQGSGYEAGLEAAARAVGCATGADCDPADAGVADLNSGFIRDNADLVIIFLADEDDCSVADRRVYHRPANPADPFDQESRFCWPDECYAYWGADRDTDLDGLMDWVDSDAVGVLKCGNPRNVVRQANPPLPTAVASYLDRLVQSKGHGCGALVDPESCGARPCCAWQENTGTGGCVPSVSCIRAAGIVGSVPMQSAVLGGQAMACFGSSLGPTNDCGCLATSFVTPGADSIWCELTELLGQRSEAYPPNDPYPGCDSMPGGRYVQFLETLATRRVAGGKQPDTLLDSICREAYDDTMYEIVNTVILTRCFDLGEVPADASRISVELNGETLPNVGLDCDQHADPSACVAGNCAWDAVAGGGAGRCEKLDVPGWSWQEGAHEICLENGLRKEIDDKFDIFLVTDVQLGNP